MPHELVGMADIFFLPLVAFGAAVSRGERSQLLNRQTRSRLALTCRGSESRLHQVVLLLQQNLAQSTGAVLASLPCPLDVAVLPLDQGWSLQIGVRQQGRLVDGRRGGARVGGRGGEGPQGGLGSARSAEREGDGAGGGSRRVVDGGSGALLEGKGDRSDLGLGRSELQGARVVSKGSRKIASTYLLTMLPSLVTPANPANLNSPATSSLSAAGPLTSRVAPGASEGCTRLTRGEVMSSAGRRKATWVY